RPSVRYLFIGLLAAMLLTATVPGNSRRERMQGMVRSLIGSLAGALLAAFLPGRGGAYLAAVPAVVFVSYFVRRFGPAYRQAGFMFMAVFLFSQLGGIVPGNFPAFAVTLLFAFICSFFAGFHLVQVKLETVLIDSLRRFFKENSRFFSALERSAVAPTPAVLGELEASVAGLKDTLLAWGTVASQVFNRNDPAWGILARAGDMQYRLGRISRIARRALLKLSAGLDGSASPELGRTVARALGEVGRSLEGIAAVLDGEHDLHLEMTSSPAAVDALSAAVLNAPGPVRAVDFYAWQVLVSLRRFLESVSLLDRALQDPAEAAFPASEPDPATEVPEPPRGWRRRVAARLGESSTRLAVQGALASFCSLAVSGIFGLQRPVWGVVMAVVVVSGTLGDNVRKALELFGGTLAGALLALALIWILPEGLVPTAAVLMILLFLWSYTNNVSYALATVWMAAFAIVVLARIKGGGTSMAAVRLYQVGLGGGFGLLVSSFVLPVKIRRRSREFASALLADVAAVARAAFAMSEGRDVPAAGAARDALYRHLDDFHESLRKMAYESFLLPSTRRRLLSLSMVLHRLCDYAVSLLELIEVLKVKGLSPAVHEAAQAMSGLVEGALAAMGRGEEDGSLEREVEAVRSRLIDRVGEGTPAGSRGETLRALGIFFYSRAMVDAAREGTPLFRDR
ncbi:MAG TPA: FUSC family protein, partial [bacterium]|nr:FUSC family protein [bacterium]